MKKKILIEGMSCEHCVKHVTTALNDLAGVSEVEVNLAAKNVIIEETQEISDEDIIAAIDEAGYEVTKIEAL